MKKIIKEIWRVVCYPFLFYAVMLAGSFVLSFITGILTVKSAINEGFVITQDELLEIINFDFVVLIATLMASILTFFIMWLIFRKEWREKKFWYISTTPIAVLILCLVLGPSLNIFLSHMIYIIGIDIEKIDFSNNLFLEIAAFGVMIPIVFDVIFRGTILRRYLETPMKVWTAVIIQALVFAVIQFEVSQGIIAFGFGMVFGILYAKFKSIWPSIARHNSLFINYYNFSYSV